MGVDAPISGGGEHLVQRLCRCDCWRAAPSINTAGIEMKRARRGVALMLVLWLVVLLTVLGARVVSAARSSSGVAANLRSRLQARYAAESGVMLATATIRDSLARLSKPQDRQAYLNALESARSPEVRLDDQRFITTFVNVNNRVDVNTASASQLTKLFSYFVGPSDAALAASAIREYVDPSALTSTETAMQSRTDIQFPHLPAANPLRALETLREIPGVPERLAIRAAPYLTVDGDGRIDRATASDTVLSAAAGSLVDEPTRILVISRGWQNGWPLTHEIQATYAIEQNSLVLVRWQERDL
jgi:general secretion pathway protein K